MVENHAEIMRDYADRLKSQRGITEFVVLRRDGSEAFRDNVTIDQINEHLGSQTYAPHPKPQTIQNLDPLEPVFAKVLASGGEASAIVAHKGGYNLFCTYSPGITHYTPAAHNFLRGSGDKATFGWSVSTRLEELREEWLAAPDDATRLSLGRAIQRQAFIDVPYVPLGLFLQPTAHRRDLSGLIQGPPLFWNIKRG